MSPNGATSSQSCFAPACCGLVLPTQIMFDPQNELAVEALNSICIQMEIGPTGTNIDCEVTLNGLHMQLRIITFAKQTFFQSECIISLLLMRHVTVFTVSQHSVMNSLARHVHSPVSINASHCIAVKKYLWLGVSVCIQYCPPMLLFTQGFNFNFSDPLNYAVINATTYFSYASHIVIRAVQVLLLLPSTLDAFFVLLYLVMMNRVLWQKSQ